MSLSLTRAFEIKNEIKNEIDSAIKDSVERNNAIKNDTSILAIKLSAITDILIASMCLFVIFAVPTFLLTCVAQNVYRTVGTVGGMMVFWVFIAVLAVVATYTTFKCCAKFVKEWKKINGQKEQSSQEIESLKAQLHEYKNNATLQSALSEIKNLNALLEEKESQLSEYPSMSRDLTRAYNEIERLSALKGNPISETFTASTETIDTSKLWVKLIDAQRIGITQVNPKTGASEVLPKKPPTEGQNLSQLSASRKLRDAVNDIEGAYQKGVNIDDSSDRGGFVLIGKMAEAGYTLDPTLGSVYQYYSSVKEGQMKTVNI